MLASSVFAESMQEALLESCRADLANKKAVVTSLVGEVDELFIRIEEGNACIALLQDGNARTERHAAQLEGHRDALELKLTRTRRQLTAAGEDIQKLQQSRDELAHNLGITEQQLAIANQQLQGVDRRARSKAAQLASKSRLADHLVSLVQTGMYQLTELHRHYVAVAVLAASKCRLVDVLNGRNALLQDGKTRAERRAADVVRFFPLGSMSP